MKTKYELIESKNNDAIYTVCLTSGKFKGIMYEYGKVELSAIETDDGPGTKLHFSYDLHNVMESPDFDKAEFEQVIGEILHGLIQEGVENNSIVYSGGVDEDRENDSSESTT